MNYNSQKLRHRKHLESKKGQNCNSGIRNNNIDNEDKLGNCGL